ncbi:MAG: hypothetical protein M3Y76_12135, partial [Chloroflexota bacterium]|nr:hypothetical protein [Chloroflexota bacterium]
GMDGMDEDDKEASESQPEEGMQPPPAPPIPLSLTLQQKRKHYFLGLVLGLIPLVIFLVGFGMALGNQGGVASGLGFPLVLLGFMLYLVELIITITYLTNKKERFVGYGLLTAFLVTPIVAAVGCSVIPTLIHR